MSRALALIEPAGAALSMLRYETARMEPMCSVATFVALSSPRVIVLDRDCPSGRRMRSVVKASPLTVEMLAAHRQVPTLFEGRTPVVIGPADPVDVTTRERD